MRPALKGRVSSRLRPFLTAVWSDLILVSYAVPDEALTPYLRPGLTLDRWQGSAWCSLVAFDFRQTRVLGVPAPPSTTLRDFPEFNLRFYVREGDRRGVVFVRELVPNAFVAGVARAIYNEPYSMARMTSRVTQIGDVRRVRHDFAFGGQQHWIAVTAHGPATVPSEDTFATWVKEQAWGFGRLRNGRPTRYRVAHPTWRTYAVEQCDLSVNLEALYGPTWQFLQGQSPDSVVLAEGSAIAVYPNEPTGQTPSVNGRAA